MRYFLSRGRVCKLRSHYNNWSLPVLFIIQLICDPCACSTAHQIKLPANYVCMNIAQFYRRVIQLSKWRVTTDHVADVRLSADVQRTLLRVINLTLCNSVHQLLCQTACQAWGIYSSSCGPVNNIFFMWIWCVKLWWSFWLAVLHSESALVLKDLFFSLTQNSSFLNKFNARQCCKKNMLGEGRKERDWGEGSPVVKVKN